MSKPAQNASKDTSARPGIAVFPPDEWFSSRATSQVLVIGAASDETDMDFRQLPFPTHKSELEFSESLPLPYDDTFRVDADRFDLVICDHVAAKVELDCDYLSEIKRIIRPGGRLLVLDTLVPGSRLRGKKARRLRDAGDYINAWMKLRDPQHRRCLSWDNWVRRLSDPPWRIDRALALENSQTFETWSTGYPLTAQNKVRLQAMLVQAPEKAERFLTPVVAEDRIVFRLIEVFILVTVVKEAVQH